MSQPLLEDAEIFSVQRSGDYVQFTVIAPQIAAYAQPGQVVVVAVGGDDSALMLRRALAIAGATTGGVHAGTITLVVDPRGPGSRWLAARTAGERLDLIGPVGTAFPLPSGPAPAVLVAVEYRTAALLPLAQALAAHGSPVEFVLGAPTATRLYGEQAAKRAGGRVTIVTDDGSAGRAGSVTDALPDAITRSRAEVVYASAPTAVLRAVGESAQRYAIRAQVAVEAPMACGTGMCLSCVVPVRSEGRVRMVRACVEGPVFEAGRIRWDAT